MEIIILKNLKDIGKTASSIICKEIKNKPDLVLGLATGNTAAPIYKNLISEYKKGKINFSKAITFNLDEYAESRALRHFMDRHLFNKINIKKENINFLDGDRADISKMCREYESKIKRLKIRLQILGLGKNAHIGFNEPGSSFNSKTRKIRLSKADNKKHKYALTMGIQTIMRAKKIILIASGKKKADAVAKAIQGKITKGVPASILQKHKNVLFLIDKAAASKLKKI